MVEGQGGTQAPPGTTGGRGDTEVVFTGEGEGTDPEQLGWWRGRPRPAPRPAPCLWSATAGSAGPNLKRKGRPEPGGLPGEERTILWSLVQGLCLDLTPYSCATFHIAFLSGPRCPHL